MLIPVWFAVNEINRRWAGGKPDTPAAIEALQRKSGIAPLTEAELTALLRKKGFYTWNQSYEPDTARRKAPAG